MLGRFARRVFRKCVEGNQEDAFQFIYQKTQDGVTYNELKEMYIALILAGEMKSYHLDEEEKKLFMQGCGVEM